MAFCLNYVPHRDKPERTTGTDEVAPLAVTQS
jgi:hypothetical protein